MSVEVPTRQQKYLDFVLSTVPEEQRNGPEPVFCLLTTVSNLIGGKWKIQVIAHLSEGTMRFGELKKAMPEVSEKMLIQALKELETDKLINRIQYPEIPPRVEYELSSTGQGLKKIVAELMEWGKNYVASHCR